MSYVQSWPPRLKHHVSWLFVQVAQPILDANEGKRVAWALVGLSSATWLLWKWPRAVPFMRRSFTHYPLSGKSYTLLTSMFRYGDMLLLMIGCLLTSNSHQSFIHLACNSLALSACGESHVAYDRINNSLIYLPRHYCILLSCPVLRTGYVEGSTA